MPSDKSEAGRGLLGRLGSKLHQSSGHASSQYGVNGVERVRLPPAQRVGLPIFDVTRLNRAERIENEAEIRALCTSAYLGAETALCRVLGRYKMFVDTQDVGLSSHLMLDGYWEMWLSEELMAILRPGMTAVDVGANLGYFTLIMADRVGPEGSVHAFEPNPPIAKRLVKSLEVNGLESRVTVHPEPLGDENGRNVVLMTPTNEPKNSFVIRSGPGLALQTRRLDSFADLLEADVIKIDAEGAELDIWHGMGGLLERRSKPQTIFLEYASARYADPAGFLREIAEAGFSFSEVTFSEGIQPRTEAQILDAPAYIDQMLALRR